VICQTGKWVLYCSGAFLALDDFEFLQWHLRQRRIIQMRGGDFDLESVKNGPREPDMNARFRVTDFPLIQLPPQR